MEYSQQASIVKKLIAMTCTFAVMIIIGGTEVTAAAGKSGHGHANNVEENLGDSKKTKNGHHGTMEAIGVAGKVSDVNRTINIIMKDNFYEPETITIKQGETIHFKIINRGTALHEFGIGTTSMHKVHQREMSIMMERGIIEFDRINHKKMKLDHGENEKAMKHDDPNSILLEPGKSGEIIWKFSQKIALQFACNIPGHYESGMMGPIQIQSF